MCCGVSVKMRDTPHGAQRSWAHFVCVCFCVCGLQNLEYPNWSSIADDAITRGGIGVLGSLFYVCGEIACVYNPSLLLCKMYIAM